MKTFEIPWVEPGQAFLSLADDPHLAFLDSAASGNKHASVSYLCPDPVAILRLEVQGEDPFKTLAAWRESQSPGDHAAPVDWPFAFAGGLVGWLGYDLGRAATGLPSRFVPLPDLPGGWFGVYDTVLGFDHGTKRAWILAAERARAPASHRLASLAARILQAPIPDKAQNITPAWQPEMSRTEYNVQLARLRDYIAAGDIYQANLTLRFTAARPAQFRAASLHAALRALSPAPFAAYLGCGNGVAIIGASPERFLQLTAAGVVESRPIKGTAARHADPAADAAAACGLLASVKERAENLMIVDLLRNDLSQVCEIGSVAVPELFAVEQFTQVHHLVSAITGRLRASLGAIDLLQASFPGGSITGAPKRRAMEIIDALEAGPRGAYCGAVIWIGFDGAMDSAIIIRSIVATPTTLFAQAGGGITWDSNAAAEYDEVMLKIAPLLAATHG